MIFELEKFYFWALKMKKLNFLDIETELMEIPEEEYIYNQLFCQNLVYYFLSENFEKDYKAEQQ